MLLTICTRLSLSQEGLSYRENPTGPWNAEVRWVSTDFCAFGQNKSVFLEEFVRLFRCIFYYCCFHLLLQRASLQRKQPLSAGFSRMCLVSEFLHALNAKALTSWYWLLTKLAIFGVNWFLGTTDYTFQMQFNLKKYEAKAKLKSLNPSGFIVACSFVQFATETGDTGKQWTPANVDKKDTIG